MHSQRHCCYRSFRLLGETQQTWCGIRAAPHSHTTCTHLPSISCSPVTRCVCDCAQQIVSGITKLVFSPTAFQSILCGWLASTCAKKRLLFCRSGHVVRACVSGGTCPASATATASSLSMGNRAAAYHFPSFISTGIRSVHARSGLHSTKWKKSTETPSLSLNGAQAACDMCQPSDSWIHVSALLACNGVCSREGPQARWYNPCTVYMPVGCHFTGNTGGGLGNGAGAVFICSFVFWL